MFATMPPRHFYALFFAFLICWPCYDKAERNRAAAPIADSMHYIDHYYVEVSDREVAMAEQIIDALRGTTIKGKRVPVRRDRRAGRPGRGRARGGGG